MNIAPRELIHKKRALLKCKFRFTIFPRQREQYKFVQIRSQSVCRNSAAGCTFFAASFGLPATCIVRVFPSRKTEKLLFSQREEANEMWEARRAHIHKKLELEMNSVCAALTRGSKMCRDVETRFAGLQCGVTAFATFCLFISLCALFAQAARTRENLHQPLSRLRPRINFTPCAHTRCENLRTSFLVENNAGQKQQQQLEPRGFWALHQQPEVSLGNIW